MSLQDDITNLTRQIESELQSATIIDKDIASEQATSAQKIDTWQQQAHRHRDAAQRMQQDMQAKQQELMREQQREAEEAKNSSQKRKDLAEGMANQLF